MRELEIELRRLRNNQLAQVVAAGQRIREDAAKDLPQSIPEATPADLTKAIAYHLFSLIRHVKQGEELPVIESGIQIALLAVTVTAQRYEKFVKVWVKLTKGQKRAQEKTHKRTEDQAAIARDRVALLVRKGKGVTEAKRRAAEDQGLSLRQVQRYCKGM